MQKFVMVKRKSFIQNEIYHVVQRAPGEELLFKDIHDRNTFLFILKKVLPEFHIHLITYSLMPNHIHLQLKIHKINLSRAMKKLFEQYAVYFNKKYNRKGHVFYGIYRLIHCCTPFSIIIVSMYIHLNTSKAGLVNNPNEYKWHSLRAFLSNVNNKFIHPKYVLPLIHPDNMKAIQIYEKYLNKIASEHYSSLLLNRKAISDLVKECEKWSDHILY